MLYVIQREDGAYVAGPGSEHSYTRRLEDARTFRTQIAAEADKCSNERVVPVDDLMRRSR